MSDKSDRLTLSPRGHFLANTPAPERAAYRNLMTNPLVVSGLLHAYAQLASGGASREELNGALKFSDIFQNISEPNQPMPSYPVKELQAGR